MNITHTFELGLVIAFDILATLGLVFTTGCLIFNIVFRKKKYDEFKSMCALYTIDFHCIQNSEDLKSKPQLFHCTRSFSHVHLHIFCCVAYSEQCHCSNGMSCK